MIKTLRNRLILSQVLPLLIIIPFMGFTLIWALETRYFLPNLEKDLVGDAEFLVELTSRIPQVWVDSSQARSLVDRFHLTDGKRIELLTDAGQILASSDPADANRIGQMLQHPGLRAAQDGRLAVLAGYSARMQGEVVDVFAPVSGPEDQPLGIVRMTYRYATVMDELKQVRFLIAGILVVGLLLGSVLGLALALQIEKPIQRVTQAIYELARGDRKEKLIENGPEEIRLLSRAVNYLFERLHSLEQARRQLLPNLVHELGRLLGALRLAIQVTQRGAKNDPALLDELLLGMDEETGRLQSLLEDLAHLHDQVYGALELNRQAISMYNWLIGVLRPWQESAKEKRLKWEISITPELPELQVDPIRLAQVVGNLVSNAIKYTPAGGNISISAGKKDGQYWIQVGDTGPGIQADELDKIFRPFYQGDQGQRVKQGMGLGLAIAHDLVTAHGGSITVNSAPGSGSQFTIWLPEK